MKYQCANCQHEWKHGGLSEPKCPRCELAASGGSPVTDCEWELSESGESYFTECQVCVDKEAEDYGFKFCGFCGRPLKFQQENKEGQP